MSNDHIRPHSIEGIKQLAKRINSPSASRSPTALSMLPLWTRHRRWLASRITNMRFVCLAAAPPQPAAVLYISVLWRDRATKAMS
jgi:hypothetical protein